MSSSQSLYTQIFAKLRPVYPDIHLTRLANWIWLVVGLLQAQSVHMSEIANHIPGPALAAGRIMKIRRWLSNKHITTRTLYEPLIQHVLSGWAGREVTISWMAASSMVRHSRCCASHSRTVTEPFRLPGK